MKTRHALFLLIAALALPGCGIKGCRDDNSSGLVSSQLPAPTYGDGRVEGIVRLEGDVPEMPVIEAAENCSGRTEPLREEWAVVDADGGLANVLVYLSDAPASTGAGREPMVLDQIDCRFTPHVLGVQVGQPLQIESSDAVLHNVHYMPDRNADENFGLSGAGQARTVAFEYPEAEPTKVRCDVHPWMTAYLGVFAHPFFAVTDEAGRFAIEQVPAGVYTVKAWHERFGTREAQIEIADAGAQTLEFTFGRSVN